MSEVYIVEPFGVSDDVIDYFSGREYNNGDHMAVVIVESKNSLKAGKSASADRRSNGFSFPFESRVEGDDFSDINRIPICALWNKYISHKDVSRCKISVRIDVNEHDYQQSSSHVQVYADELLATHIEHLVLEYRQKFGIKTDRRAATELIIPIPNELTEYCQEYLIRSLKKRGFDVTFVWREVAILMRFMKISTARIFYSGQRIKVAYVGEDSLESCVFEIVNHEGVLVPVRHRPIMKKSLLAGFDFASFCMKDHFRSQNREDLASDKVLWQILNTRSDAWQAVCGITPDESLLPVEGTSLELLPTIECNLDVTAPFSRSLLFKEVLSLNDSDESQSLLDFTLDNDSGEYDAVLLCGDVVNSYLSSKLAYLASKKNINVWYSDEELVLGGCRLYKHNLDNNLPTYLDSLPPLEILYQSGQEFEWATLVESGQLVEGGKEFVSPEPFEKLGMPAGTNKLPIYLKVEAADQDDDGIHFEEKRLDKITSNVIPLSITVSMKPAFGLAKVTIKDRQKFLPENGYNFDYSTMKKGSIPNIELAYPLDLKMSVLKVFNNVLEDTSRSLENVRLDVPGLIKLLEVLKVGIADNSATQKKYFRHFDIELNAGTARNQKLLNDCLRKIEVLCRKEYVLEQINNNSTLVVNLSHLFKGTPNRVKSLLLDHIHSRSRVYKTDKFFHPACRTLYDSEENIKAIYAYFTGLSRESRNKIYIARGLLFLLKFVPLSKNCLDEKTACAMVEMSRDMFNEGVIKKTYKQKFVSATLLLLYSLKYRFHNNSFMTLEYEKADYYRKRLLDNEIYGYIETALKALNGSPKATDKTYARKLSTYSNEIRLFIEKRGNQSFITEVSNDEGN